jgi:hypothetical protein
MKKFTRMHRAREWTTAFVAHRGTSVEDVEGCSPWKEQTVPMMTPKQIAFNREMLTWPSWISSRNS